MKNILISMLLFFSSEKLWSQSVSDPYVVVLGVAQDGGYPHIGCQKQCCDRVWENDSLGRSVVSLGVADPENKKWYLLEATPDITEQLELFQQLTKSQFNFLPDGIFITHAHIGHYTGLMYLGREAMSTRGVQVYVLPRMKTYLENNGPWSQLVTLHNIQLNQLKEDRAIRLTPNVSIKAFRVPHRDEYSETAGFKVITKSKKYLFIPDIDKWQKWDRNIVEEVKQVDFAFLDATFYSADELPGRTMADVPHPLVSETMELFGNESNETKKKILFIHFNHTNPLLWDAETENKVHASSFGVAKQGSVVR